MKNNIQPYFDSKLFLDTLSTQLLETLDKSSIATTPGLIGSAREYDIRERLEKVLPGGVGVGTGCVISSDGHVSAQQDIILFEKNVCPVFFVSCSKDIAYYPCEGVIAVGEIKSSIGKKELFDSVDKIASVKKLKRKEIAGLNISDEYVKLFRRYLSRQSLSGLKSEEFDQESKPIDQIYGFGICSKLSIKPNTLIKNLETKIHDIPEHECPNLFIALNSAIIHPFCTSQNTLSFSGKKYISGRNKQSSFSFLISRIYQIVEKGRSSPIKSFESYILEDRSLEMY